MSIIWLLAGFVLCLFMPTSIQMMVKSAISALYKKFTGGNRDIAW
jgi:hypothetical protein